MLIIYMVSTDLENLEDSGNSKNCQSHGKLREIRIFMKKKLSVSWKSQGNVEYSMWHSGQQKCIPANYSLWNCSGKV